MRNDFIFNIGGYQLPVTPGEISISNGVTINKIDLANGGKVPRFVGPELKTISFTAEFPKLIYTYTYDLTEEKKDVPVYRPYVYQYALSPVEYWNAFFTFMKSGEPVEVIINGFGEHLVSGRWLIESMERKYAAENGSDMQVDFTLVQYWQLQTCTFIEVPAKKKTDKTWVSSFGERLVYINDSAKKYLEDLADYSHNATIDNTIYELDKQVNRYNNTPLPPEFHTVSGENETFVTLAVEYYKDVRKANYIRDMNALLYNYSLTQPLPKNTRVRVGITREDVRK